MSLSSSSTVDPLTSPVYDPFPIPQTTDESTWKIYLEKSSTRIEGEYVKDARIIFLGDIHNEKWQNAWRRGVIERYGSSKDDIVLCEGAQAYTRIPCIPPSLQLIDGTSSLHEKMNLYGWEDISLVKSTVHATAKVVSLYEKYKAPGSKWSQTDTTTALALIQQINKETIDRNTSLIATTTTIYKALKPDQKVFVIAGASHLFKKGDSSSKEYNILDSFSGMKACLLVPKRTFTPTEKDVMQYAKTVAAADISPKETPKLPPKASDSSVAIPKETDKDTSSKETTKSVSDSSAIIPSTSSKKKKRKETNSFSSPISSKKPGPSLKIES